MIRRLKKQLSYATGAGVALLAVIILIALLSSRSGSSNNSTPSPTPSFSALILEHTYVIQHPGINGVDTNVDIVAQVRNPNPAAGVSSLDLVFTLNDTSGQEITHFTKNAYILPGALQYVMSFNVPLQHRTLGQVNVTFNKEPDFIVLPSSVNLPQFSAFAKDRLEKVLAGKSSEEQHGIVKNTSTFDWGKVEVFVLGLDKTGTVVAAGQTFVGALKVGEEREFTVTWPSPVSPIDRLIVLPSTNIYREDNVIQAVGDPTLLR